VRRVLNVFISSFAGALNGALLWAVIVFCVVLTTDTGKEPEGLSPVNPYFIAGLAFVGGGIQGFFIGAALALFSSDKMFRTILVSISVTLLLVIPVVSDLIKAFFQQGGSTTSLLLYALLTGSILSIMAAMIGLLTRLISNKLEFDLKPDTLENLTIFDDLRSSAEE